MSAAQPKPVIPKATAFRASVTTPGSKSLTNRAMLLAALADEATTLTAPLTAQDTEVMATALLSLGILLEIHDRDDGTGEWERLTIHGIGSDRRLQGNVTLDLCNAGTATRFLTAAAGVCADSPVTIDGNPRMRQRPIAVLANALTHLGATIEYLDQPDHLPLRIHPASTIKRAAHLPCTQSSQFISALLMIAPCLPDGLTLTLDPPVTSASYVGMTLSLMERFGARFEVEGPLTTISVAPGGYTSPGTFAIEPDASSATYFLAAAAVIPESVCTIENLGRGSLQPDAGFADVLAQMGAGLTFGSDFITVLGPKAGLTGIDIDMAHMPDAAMTLAVTALFAKGETVIRGLATLQHKETDRLHALKTELAKFGANVEIEDNEILVIEPPTSPDAPLFDNSVPIEVDTYDDHRMAMAFAVAAAARGNVIIRDPDCVNKTYPTFWHDFLSALDRRQPSSPGPSPRI
ncbi:MAG: 3-phosphoshikimate 1-carboxyvinyltransferase [Planctomycetes bacterium]|nr:3-phosphoshikimate 1-carboxyvinyltransferase [Planctomycetota bacterium]NOG54258.1 3-phosphoshikimate 1-carboxyvinyltransferase [Planctomycetota bacterium]